MPESGSMPPMPAALIAAGSSNVPAGPAATAGSQWQVSTDGGILPVWRADGKELYYLNPAGEGGKFQAVGGLMSITGAAALM